VNQEILRRRLVGLRNRRNVNQAVLSDALGFNDRQTLSDIENGKRLISPEELVRAARFFRVEVDYFTDPLELAGEATFSWRKQIDGVESIKQFESKAGRWIATYRHFSRLKGDSVNSSLTQIDLSEASTFEHALAEGDAVSRSLGLGDVPAIKVVDVLENQQNTLALFVDAPAEVSGAACQLGPLNTIIINRGESEGRRSFNLGHELFHLITWHQMPPPHIELEEELSSREKRIEKLADHFAAGLLMPRQSVEAYVSANPLPNKNEKLAGWLRSGAAHFRVSGQALKWRLVGIGLIKKSVAMSIPDTNLRVEQGSAERCPPRFSHRFISVLGWGIDQGHLSVRRAAQVTGSTVDDFANLFAEHGLKTPFDL